MTLNKQIKAQHLQHTFYTDKSKKEVYLLKCVTKLYKQVKEVLSCHISLVQSIVYGS